MKLQIKANPRWPLKLLNSGIYNTEMYYNLLNCIIMRKYVLYITMCLVSMFTYFENLAYQLVKVNPYA